MTEIASEQKTVDYQKTVVVAAVVEQVELKVCVCFC